MRDLRRAPTILWSLLALGCGTGPLLELGGDAGGDTVEGAGDGDGDDDDVGAGDGDGSGDGDMGTSKDMPGDAAVGDDGPGQAGADAGDLMCQSDEDCPTMHCDTERGRCQACVDREDCPVEAPLCMDGICAPCAVDGDCEGGDEPFCGGSGACIECRDDADCEAPRRCVAFECVD